jgi:hypothetical protein
MNERDKEEDQHTQRRSWKSLFLYCVCSLLWLFVDRRRPQFPNVTKWASFFNVSETNPVVPILGEDGHAGYRGKRSRVIMGVCCCPAVVTYHFCSSAHPESAAALVT